MTRPNKSAEAQKLIAGLQRAIAELHQVRQDAVAVDQEIARRMSIEIRLFEVYIDQLRRWYTQ